MKGHHNTLDDFGMDVKIENEKLAPDPWAARLIKDVGETMKPTGMSYIGSFATHIYESEFGREIALKHHHKFVKPTSEKVVSMAVKDAAIHLMSAVFGRHKPRTLDRRDKRK